METIHEKMWMYNGTLERDKLILTIAFEVIII